MSESLQVVYAYLCGVYRPLAMRNVERKDSYNDQSI